MKTKYAKEINEIWEKFIPKSGASAVLQGELLRILEKIQHEIQDNGMVNWDDDYQYMAHFLKEKLMSEVFGESKDMEEGDLAIMQTERIKRQGEEALRASREEQDMKWLEDNQERMLEDKFYEPIYDVIAEWYLAHPQPISYKHEREIRR